MEDRDMVRSITCNMKRKAVEDALTKDDAPIPLYERSKPGKKAQIGQGHGEDIRELCKQHANKAIEGIDKL
ncbi:hypothetical protein BGZ58_006777 [Dissophora ornata]|nr:hypothetical protein BGZ58_006777 [Dissophora ornata]